MKSQIIVNREDVDFAVENSEVRLYENYTFSVSDSKWTTFGVIGATHGLLKFFVALTIHDPDLAFQLAGVVTHDSFGQDRIYYFPGFDLVEKDGDRDELEDGPEDSAVWRADNPQAD